MVTDEGRVDGGMEMRMKTPKEGASTVLRAALDPSLPGTY